MTYFLGIDISTTASKALLIDEKGIVIGMASSPHTLQSPYPLWSEQDPLEWWGAVTNSIRIVLHDCSVEGEEIAAIGLTGQMHGLILLDEQGNVLRPAILWNDQRTQVQCNEIHKRIGKKKYLQISGNVALTGFTAPKILWVAQNEPEVFDKVRHVLLPKDFIRYKLTGDYATDKADGSGTALFDIHLRDWSPEVLSALEIDSSWMPRSFEGPEITGGISIEGANATGLKAGTPVVAGGSDQAAMAVGVGAVEPGVIALTVGTSGVVFATTPLASIESEGRLHTFCHAVPKMWHLMGVMLSAAGSLQWYRDTISPNTSFDDLLAEAESIPAGSDGLQFLPYLSGERTPYADPLARGAFIGLTIRHTRGHMTRAVLEGVAFGLKDCFELVQNAGLGEIAQVRVSGGGMKNKLWRQILASILETDISIVNTTESSAYGAALLAAVGIGIWTDVVSACRDTIKISDKMVPHENQVATYQKAGPIFRELYPVLCPSFIKLDDIH